MNLKFAKLSENATTPTKAHNGDAGYDLYAAEDATIRGLGRKLIKTDIALSIPDGFYGRIAGRSGNALKKGWCILGGIIDSSYRGNIGVIIFNTESLHDDNWNKNATDISKGDKIAQIIITPCPHFDLEEVSSLDETTRGENGYGSTGK